MLTFSLYSQSSTPPPTPPGHGTNGNQCSSGGGAPIDGGLFILLGLATAYGGCILYKRLKEHKNRELIR